MKPNTRRALVFGSIVGTLWSLVPGLLSGLLYKEGRVDAYATGLCAKVLCSGAIKGMCVSLVLGPFLKKRGWKTPLLLGAGALPFGAFIFGMVITVVHFAVKQFGGATYRFATEGFNSLSAGAQYALFGSISIIAIALYPLSIATTFGFQREMQNPSSRPAP